MRTANPSSGPFRASRGRSLGSPHRYRSGRPRSAQGTFQDPAGSSSTLGGPTSFTDKSLFHDLRGLGTEPVDALEAHRRAAAFRGLGALLVFLSAAIRLAATDQLAGCIRSAKSVAALVAGFARDAVRMARVDHPEAAHVARIELLTRQVKCRMAR